MVFKRSAFLLLAATAAAVATTEASDPQAQQKHAVETKHHGHKHHGKEVTEKQGDGENVKTYKHGQVHKAKGKGGDAAAAPAPAKKSHKKHAKQVAETTAPPTTKPTEAPEEDDEGSDGSDDTDDATVGTGDEADTEEQDFKLKVGEAVDIDVDGQKYTLEHFANGSTVIIYPNHTHQWVNNQDIYLDFETDGSSDDEAGSLSASGSGVGGSDVGDEDDTIVADDENGVSGIAKKFSEFATKITGGSLKGAAPVILVGSAIGALAAVVGIAVVAMRRARTNSAEEDPASVLADATEDVEAGAKKTEDKKDDEAADESKALDASESESESDESEQEAHFV